MPTRYFCDIDGTEIPADQPYFLMELSETNRNSYSRPSEFISKTQRNHVPIAGAFNMLCSDCAVAIRELLEFRNAVPSDAVPGRDESRPF